MTPYPVDDEDMARPNREKCTTCGRAAAPWATTCPVCAAPIVNGAGPNLADQPAPARPESRQWIDIDVTSDQPVEAALLRHFLLDNGFEVEETRRFISVPAAEHARLSEAVQIWTVSGDLPEDSRQVDSLSATLRDLSFRVQHAIHLYLAQDGSPEGITISLDLR